MQCLWFLVELCLFGTWCGTLSSGVCVIEFAFGRLRFVMVRLVTRKRARSLSLSLSLCLPTVNSYNKQHTSVRSVHI